MRKPRDKSQKPMTLFPKVQKIKGSIEDLNLFTYVVLAGSYVNSLGSGSRPKKKREFLENLCRMSIVSVGSATLSRVRESLDNIRDALLRNGYHVKKCRIVSEWRGLVGVGSTFGKTLFEVGLSFDPVLNVPYIPSSSLKGAFRHVLEQQGKKNEATQIFGSEKSMGLVGVTDAYPVPTASEHGFRLFDPDVLTPHYSGEYVRTELDVKPVPVVFVAIAPGVEFEFYIYYDRNLQVLQREQSRKVSGVHVYEGDLAQALKGTQVSVDQLPLVDYAVIYALTRGIGAKTSIGYSRFKLLEYITVSD